MNLVIQTPAQHYYRSKVQGYDYFINLVNQIQLRMPCQVETLF